MFSYSIWLRSARVATKSGMSPSRSSSAIGVAPGGSGPITATLSSRSPQVAGVDGIVDEAVDELGLVRVDGLVFEGHGRSDVTGVLGDDLGGAVADGVVEAGVGDQGVDELAVDRGGHVGELGDGDATVQFGTLELGDGDPADPEPFSQDVLAHTQCGADGTDPPAARARPYVLDGPGTELGVEYTSGLLGYLRPTHTYRLLEPLWEDRY